MKKPPRLPQLLDRKIYKTGQTRGADDDEIYQNRVSRESTVLIPYRVWELARKPPEGESTFTYGSITLISPDEYFGSPNIAAKLKERSLRLGHNALVFYETRADWNKHNPVARGWQPAESRRSPLGGQFVARIAGTTGIDGERILRGFTKTSNKGAGIRAYEYASKKCLYDTRQQLELLFWLCEDAFEIVVANGMTSDEAKLRCEANKLFCTNAGLYDETRLKKSRIISNGGITVCPFCLESLSGVGFFSRMKQAEGREVQDITVTQVNLFHVEEIRYGLYNHRPYNLGWGHHHCNVVVKDDGIGKTLQWMEAVLQRNKKLGYLP